MAMEVERRAYDEMVDLFARGATSADVLAFRPSEDAKERVRYLLARNGAGKLSEEEAAELNRFGELDQLMQLVKARAQLHVERRP